jgi:hypothetical protein
MTVHGIELVVGYYIEDIKYKRPIDALEALERQRKRLMASHLSTDKKIVALGLLREKMMNI